MFAYDAAIPLVGIHSVERHIYVHQWTIFINEMSTNSRMDELQYIHMMEPYMVMMIMRMNKSQLPE